MCICVIVAVFIFNFAQRSWLSCLDWHLRDVVVAKLLILREVSQLETITSRNNMYYASMRLLVGVRLAILHLSLIKLCMVFFDYFFNPCPQRLRPVHVNQDIVW